MASQVNIKILREVLGDIPPDDYRVLRDSYYDANGALRGLVIALETIVSRAPIKSRRGLNAELKIARNALYELGESELGEVL